MNPDAPHFDEQGRLIAPRYDDVYFSASDGLAETRHVFIQGNHLATRFAALKPGERFTIGETGLGTGLNFLAAWQWFDQHAPEDAQLDFVSVEGLPLDRETIAKALSPWPELAPQREAFLQQWGAKGSGVHRFRFARGRVTLTLWVGEVADVLAQCEARVDAWFLDGFAPSRNPAMWSEAVFQQVARLSAPQATLATYTAAGFVRRGLGAAGFEVEKQLGFGTKRDMTVGRFVGAKQGRKALVIGGSLAGVFAARALAERGVSVTVVERQGSVEGELPALSPRVAVLQPKISDKDDPAGQWLRAGYAIARRRLMSDEALCRASDWRACGTFQAAVDARAERRLRRFVEQFGATGLCEWVDAEQTEAHCGIALPVGGVWVAGAGVLRPAGLCAGLLDHPGITLRDGVAVQALSREGIAWRAACSDSATISADAVVIANALGAGSFEPTCQLDLRPVRGQVTLLRAADQAGPLSALRCAVFYGGYVLPAVAGLQTLGASFVPGDRDTAWRDREHVDVCDKLARVLPEQAQPLRGLERPAGWVGLRTTTPTRRCYADEIESGLYVSLGHGSHGIASAAQAAEHLAAMITEMPSVTR